jgi:NarL family two-component system response regulator LiaR
MSCGPSFRRLRSRLESSHTCGVTPDPGGAITHRSQRVSHSPDAVPAGEVCCRSSASSRHREMTVSHIRQASPQASLGNATTDPSCREMDDPAVGGPTPLQPGSRWTEALPSARRLTIALVENHDLVTMGLSQMLAPYAPRLGVLKATGQQSGKRADLVLMDPCVDRTDEAYAAEVIAGVSLGRQLVIYTWATSSSPGGLERLLAAGWPIRGWLSKTLPADDLVRALERIQAGHFVVLDQRLSERTALRAVPTSLTGGCQLSARESDVVAMIAQGMTNQDIADATYLSINTVKTYVRAAYRKMGVTSRTQAVLWSVSHGLDIVPWQIVQGVSRQSAPLPARRISP